MVLKAGRGGERLGESGGGGRCGAGVDRQGVAASVFDVQHDLGQVVSGSQHRGGQPNAPVGGSGGGAEAGAAMVLAVAEGVACERLEVGNERIAAPVGIERARRELPFVVPTHKTATAGRCGGEGDGVGVGAGVGAAAGDGAIAGVVGGGSDRGGGAEAVVGLNADDGHIVQVEGVGGVAARAARGGIEVAEGVVAIAGAAPAPVDMELAAIGVAVAHKAVSGGAVVAGVDDRAAVVEFVHQQGAPFGTAVVVYRHLPQGALILEIGAQGILGRGP